MAARIAQGRGRVTLARKPIPKHRPCLSSHADPGRKVPCSLEINRVQVGGTGIFARIAQREGFGAMELIFAIATVALLGLGVLEPIKSGSAPKISTGTISAGSRCGWSAIDAASAGLSAPVGWFCFRFMSARPGGLDGSRRAASDGRSGQFADRLAAACLQKRGRFANGPARLPSPGSVSRDPRPLHDFQ